MSTTQKTEENLSDGAAETLSQPVLQDKDMAFLDELVPENDNADNGRTGEEPELDESDSPEETETDDGADGEESAEDVTQNEDDDAGVDEQSDEGDDAEEPEGSEETDGESEESEDADGDEDGDEGDDAEEPDDGLTEIPEELQPTVGKLLKKTREKERAKVAKRLAELETVANRATELEQTRATLEGELDRVKAAKVVPSPTKQDPFADVTTAEDLQSIEDRYWQARQRLVKNPDSIEVDDGDGGKRYLSDAEVREKLAVVDEHLQRRLPQKRKWLEQHEQFDGQLVQVLPEIDDPKSEISRAVNKVITALPEVKKFPGYRTTALAQVLGNTLISEFGKDALQKLEELRAAKAGAGTKPNQPARKKPAAVKKPVRAPKPPQSKPAPPRGDSRGRLSDEEFFEALADG